MLSLLFGFSVEARNGVGFCLLKHKMAWVCRLETWWLSAWWWLTAWWLIRWLGLADLGLGLPISAWICQSQPVVVGLRCRDRPRVVGLRWVWVFAEAHQLEDLFMEPWVEATCGGEGGGEIWVCSSRSGFFFFLIL